MSDSELLSLCFTKWITKTKYQYPHKTFRFAEVDFDDCFSELDGDNGIAEMTIESSELLIALWQDEAFDFVMVFTTNEFDDIHGHKQAVAIESQSCIANAFNTNPPLLKPGKSFTGSWGVIHTSC
jgi:aldose 1-epimerase